MNPRSSGSVEGSSLKKSVDIGYRQENRSILRGLIFLLRNRSTAGGRDGRDQCGTGDQRAQSITCPWRNACTRTRRFSRSRGRTIRRRGKLRGRRESGRRRWRCIHRANGLSVDGLVQGWGEGVAGSRRGAPAELGHWSFIHITRPFMRSALTVRLSCTTATDFSKALLIFFYSTIFFPFSVTVTKRISLFVFRSRLFVCFIIFVFFYLFLFDFFLYADVAAIVGLSTAVANFCTAPMNEALKSVSEST